jgi:glycolate oxidase FAD binding subunit
MTPAFPALRQRLEGLRPAVPFADTSRYVVDGCVPSLVAAPQDAEALAAVLAAAADAGVAVVPWGGGAHMGLGNPPRRYDLALDVTRLDRVIEHEPADLTVTVEAGVRLRNLQGLLAANGQWLAIDPPAAGDSTIGGLLAANLSGPARVAHGTLRDLLIGITVATAQGRLVRSGGRVVKNVAGYDMGKLHVGALGTLGVIVAASFKVAPLPAVTAHALVHHAEAPRLLALAFAVRDAGLAANGLALARGAEGGRWALAVRFAGGRAAVDRSLRDLLRLANDAGASPVDGDIVAWEEALRPAAARDAESVVAKAAVRPSDAGAILRAAAAGGGGVVAYPTAGLVYASWPAAPGVEVLALLRAQAESLGGALVLEAAPSALKTSFDAWGATRGDFQLMRRLKAEMDPGGLLSPGRYLGGL